jgi:hypothetical protein
MAGTTATSKAKATEGSADLSPDEQEDVRASDERDTSPRAKSDVSGKRVRAIPSVITKNTGHATTIEVRRSDFKSHDIDHPTVTWDFRKENFTVKVGDKSGQISQEAADFLTSKFPTSYEYIDES